MDKNRRLIQASLKGDASSFEEIYLMHAPRLMGVCLRYALDRDEAQDLLQEAFIKIYKKLNTYNIDSSFEGWLHRITVNVALDNFRKKQRSIINSNVGLADIENEKAATTDVYSQIAHQDLLHLVQGLPPAYRMVFNLYVIEGYKHHEIATMLKVSEGTSKSNLSDARKILQKKIKQLIYEDSDRS